jgi:hypothetical protein
LHDHSQTFTDIGTVKVMNINKSEGHKQVDTCNLNRVIIQQPVSPHMFAAAAVVIWNKLRCVDG